MKVLVVMAHPRRHSLTGQVADAVMAGLAEAGHEAELADLYGEGFDPVMPPSDEPDWGREDKRYSAVVEAEVERLNRNRAIVLVFPIWWWSFPAMMKGWIDRVWNKDIAYGARKLTHRRALAIGLSASSAKGYAEDGYDKAIETEVVAGMFAYCGIGDSRFAFLHGSTEGGERAREMVAEARALGRGFLDGAD